MVWLSGRLRWGCRVLSAVPVTVSPSRTAFRAPHCHTCHRQWRHLHQRCQVPHHAPPLASARWVCRWPARHITCWARCRRRWPARHITCWTRCRRRWSARHITCWTRCRRRWPARHMRTPLEVPLQDRRRASARPPARATCSHIAEGSSREGGGGSGGGGDGSAWASGSARSAAGAAASTWAATTARLAARESASGRTSGRVGSGRGISSWLSRCAVGRWLVALPSGSDGDDDGHNGGSHRDGHDDGGHYGGGLDGGGRDDRRGRHGTGRTILRATMRGGISPP
jgi:hypothetical protein